MPLFLAKDMLRPRGCKMDSIPPSMLEILPAKNQTVKTLMRIETRGMERAVEVSNPMKE